MLQVSVGDYIIHMSESILEQNEYGFYAKHAKLVEEFGLERADREAFSLTVLRGDLAWPFLCVAQRYFPDAWAGSYPGVLLAPETDVLFVGAGERLLAYDLKRPIRLWEDLADTGFHGWFRYGDTVVMSAELGLVAWDISGAKLWTTYAEPPWEYHVDGDIVHLDVMGAISTFPLRAGPSGS